MGSCRDCAWLLVSVAAPAGPGRPIRVGLPGPAGLRRQGARRPVGPAADFTDLHAWAEVYIPGAGWIGLDATSGLFAGEGHIPLAATPSPASAAPITGGVEPCESTMEFSNTVSRIHEDPRVTLPYTDEAWATIQDVGPRRRRPARSRRRPAHHRRRADLRLGRQPGRRRVDHRRRRRAQAAAGLRPGRPTESAMGAAGPGPPRPGQVVSR